ncbi:MAG: hypothetical protein LAP40_25525 [Acidobacteriia bacterium]|nr:hypothetical protein [Terriglobia bacterium]
MLLRLAVLALFAGPLVASAPLHVVAAWEPPAPQVEWRSLQSAPPVETPVAISATGRYVAEGASTLLRIYELP